MSILSKLKEEARQKSKPKDLSIFNDELAYKIKWLPLKGGGANFQTRVLHEESSGHFGRIEYRVGFGLKLFSGIFISVGLILFLGFCSAFYLELIEAPIVVLFVVMGTGVVFTITGFLFYFFISKPIVFDKKQGYFWKGRKAPSQVFNIEKIKNATRLNEIHAIQLISEVIPKEDNLTYASHEINLVLRGGKRLNVIDHGRHDIILSDAKILSNFLNVPVWDATFKED